MFKRCICLLLCAGLVMGIFSATAENEIPSFVMAGFDGEGTYRTWSSNLFFKRMEEKTGVHFTFDQCDTAVNWTKEKEAMQASDPNLPDVLFKANLTQRESEILYDRGVLIDLKPLLADNCPNLCAIFHQHPEYEDQISLSDGQIVSLPYISPSPTQNCMWINKKWLSALNMNEPTDIETLTQVLKAFKEKDPNRNGKQDEIPLAFLGAFDLKFLAHGFGLIANDYNIFAQDGTVRFFPLEDNFRPFIQWCRNMYQDGLFDIDGFSTTDTLRMVTDKNATQTYGVVLTASVANLMPASWMTDYEILMPLYYEGEQKYRSFSSNLFRGTFAITSHCSDPAAILRWVDTLYGEEGAILASAGLENIDYVVDGDGTWRLTESTQSNNYFTQEALIISGITPPGISADDFQGRYFDQALSSYNDELIALNQIAERPFPYYDLTDEQAIYITPFQNKIGMYVDEQIARWVLGEIPISDQSFADFEQHLIDLGLHEFMAFWQDILNDLS